MRTSAFLSLKAFGVDFALRFSFRSTGQILRIFGNGHRKKSATWGMQPPHTIAVTTPPVVYDAVQ